MPLNTRARLARNSIAMTGALVIKRAATFMLSILIARHLGILAFGQFSVAYTFYIIFEVLAMFGLANLIVREVAKNKSEFHKYLINGHLIILMASLASIGIWMLLLNVLKYSPPVIKASYLFGLALIPFAMSTVCEAIFKAFERMQFVTYAFGLANLAKIGLAWLLLSLGFGLLSIIGLMVVIQWAMLLMEWYFIYRYFPSRSLVIDLRFCRNLAKASTTFLGISAFSVIFLRLNIIVLSKLRGEVEVGLYNSAFQLVFAAMLIFMSLKEAFYPVLSRTYQTNMEKFKRYAESSIEFLMSFSLPLAVYFFFLANSILLVYKEQFIAATPLLKLLGWVLIPLCFSTILGGVMLASGRQKDSLVIQIVNIVILFPLSIFCIQRYGFLGAGVAVLAIHIICFVLQYRVVARKVFTISIPRVIWKPTVSSLFLAGFLILIREGRGLLVIIPSAFVLYAVVLLSLNFFFGGLREPVRAWLGRGKSKPGIRSTET